MFWSLSGREFSALKFQWAESKAQTVNLQANTEGIPFTASDFMGLTDRTQRIAEAKRQKTIDEFAVQGEKLRLFRMSRKKGDTTGIHPAFLGKGKRG